MRTLKFILLFIAGLIVLLLIVAAFVPREFKIEREVVIEKPIDEVYDYVSSLASQNEWSVWGKMDPNMKVEFRGEDRTVGFVSAWEGNENVGKGEQEITNLEYGKRIDFELRFLEPWEAKNDSYILTEPVNGDQTRVQWGMKGKSPYPFNLMNLFMGGALGKDFDQGLQNLKEILENRN